MFSPPQVITEQERKEQASKEHRRYDAEDFAHVREVTQRSAVGASRHGRRNCRRPKRLAPLRCMLWLADLIALTLWPINRSHSQQQPIRQSAEGPASKLVSHSGRGRSTRQTEPASSRETNPSPADRPRPAACNPVGLYQQVIIGKRKEHFEGAATVRETDGAHVSAAKPPGTGHPTKPGSSESPSSTANGKRGGCRLRQKVGRVHRLPDGIE